MYRKALNNIARVHGIKTIEGVNNELVAFTETMVLAATENHLFIGNETISIKLTSDDIDELYNDFQQFTAIAGL